MGSMKKKEWKSPELHVHGSIENVTGWLGACFSWPWSPKPPWQPPDDGGYPPGS